MSENRIAATLAQGYRRVGMQGQPLIAAYGQMSQILRNRLGREHADLFARPNLDPTTGSIEWLSPHAGAVRQAATLPEHERLPLEALTTQLLREIRQLADKLKREGPSAELVGKMLELAADLPPGDWLYDIEGKPVLIMWGHAPETGNAAVAATVPPPVVAAAANTAAVTDAAATAAAAATTATLPVRRPLAWRRWWWLILLLLLLLLALLLGWYLRAHSDTDAILGTPRARSAAIDGALARQRELLAELATLRGRAPPPVGECSRSDPERVMPPAPGPIPGPLPDPVPGPGRRPGPGNDVVPGPVDPQAPASAASGGMRVPTPGPVDSVPPVRTNPPPDDSRRDDIARRGDASNTAPPLPKPEDALQLPPKPDPQLGFLRGNWRGGPGLTDTSGRPIDLGLKFGDDGKGTVSIRRPEDGAVCNGPVQGAMRDGKLQVEGSGPVSCQGGGNFAPPRFECGRDRRGQTICNGLNKDGSTYEMDISKAR